MKHEERVMPYDVQTIPVGEREITTVVDATGHVHIYLNSNVLDTFLTNLRHRNKQRTEERVMTKWSSPAVDAYVEALRREHHLPPWRNPDGSLAVTPAEEKAHEAAVAEEMPTCVLDPIDEIERTETKQPRVHFAYEADEPERLRRVFASWDFRNGT